MKKKIFTLLALLLTVCSGAWAAVTDLSFTATKTVTAGGEIWWTTKSNIASANTAGWCSTNENGNTKKYGNITPSLSGDASGDASSYVISADAGVLVKGSNTPSNLTTSKKAIVFKVTNTTAITAYGATASSSNAAGLQWSVYKASDKSAVATSAKGKAAATNNTCTISISGLSASETYIVSIEGGYQGTAGEDVGSTNQDVVVYAVKFIAPAAGPTITTQPVSASYLTNAAATALSVEATASAGDLSYQWYSNTTESTEGATQLTGATSATYTPSTTAAGTTYYYCAVTDDNGTVNSDFAAITVGSAYTVTTSVNNADYGTVTATDTYIGGNDAVITATPNAGYKFASWTVDGTENASTTNPYTFGSIDADHTIQAVFEAYKQITYSVATANNGTRTDNFVMEYADDDDKFTAPTNLYLSSDNQTLTGWSDGTTTYAVGAEIDCSAGDKTLSPVFTDNSGASFAATLDARQAGFTTTWNLGRSYVNFNVEGKTAYYVQQATIAGATVDIPMYIDATSGKVNNVNRTDALAQTNTGTIFTIPVVDGSIVTINSYAAFSTTTINGSTGYDKTNSDKTATYTYSGLTGTINIALTGDVQYISSISVTYPSPYSVTYDGNGATSGSVTDANTYDKDASVTTQTNSFVKSGYAFTGWNTKADGSGTAIAEGATFTITGNTKLYAQWMEGTEATITYVLADINNDSGATTITSTFNSTATQVTEVAGITNNTGSSYGTGSKTNLTVKIPTDAAYTADHYMSVSFTIAGGYKFTPTTISVKAQPVSTNKTVKLVLTDGTNSIEKTQENLMQGVITAVVAGNDGATSFTGNVTLKIYCYGATDNYRLGSPISIVGVLDQTAMLAQTQSGRNYATCVTPGGKTLDFGSTEGITAYIATSLDKVNKTIHLKKVDVVPENTPIIYKTDAKGGSAYVKLTDVTPDAVGENLLVPGDGTDWNGTSGYTYYYLAGDEFHKATSGKLQFGKAYFKIADSEVPAGAPALGFVFADSETTGVDASLVNNGVVNNEIYNLNGQRVAQPTKGLYIVNGKKVIVK